MKSDNTVGKYLDKAFLKSTIDQSIEKYTIDKRLNLLLDEVNLEDLEMIFEDVKDCQVEDFKVSLSPLDIFTFYFFLK